MEEVLSRNQQQEKVFFIIYQALFCSKIHDEFDIVSIIEETLDESFDKVPLFVKEASVKVLKHYQDIKDIIEPNLKRWTWDRLNLVNVAILMLAIGEYKYVGEVDKSVIIDVAVKLAKKYSDAKDYKFINALLDNVL